MWMFFDSKHTLLHILKFFSMFLEEIYISRDIFPFLYISGYVYDRNRKLGIVLVHHEKKYTNLKKYTNQFSDSHNFIDVSIFCANIENLYIIFKEPEFLTEKAFSIMFSDSKSRKKCFYAVDLHSSWNSEKLWRPKLNYDVINQNVEVWSYLL